MACAFEESTLIPSENAVSRVERIRANWNWPTLACDELKRKKREETEEEKNGYKRKRDKREGEKEGLSKVSFKTRIDDEECVCLLDGKTRFRPTPMSLVGLWVRIIGKAANCPHFCHSFLCFFHRFLYVHMLLYLHPRLHLSDTDSNIGVPAGTMVHLCQQGAHRTYIFTPLEPRKLCYSQTPSVFVFFVKSIYLHTFVLVYGTHKVTIILPCLADKECQFVQDFGSLINRMVNLRPSRHCSYTHTLSTLALDLSPVRS